MCVYFDGGFTDSSIYYLRLYNLQVDVTETVQVWWVITSGIYLNCGYVVLFYNAIAVVWFVCVGCLALTFMQISLLTCSCALSVSDGVVISKRYPQMDTFLRVLVMKSVQQ